MKDIMGMMGKVKEMQAKMEGMQEELSNLEAEGTAGGGMVTVVLTGKGVMKRVSIDPSLLKEDEAEIVEDLIVAAHAIAKDKAEEMTKEKTAELTAGLPIPPGFKLPF
ncbi:MAG: YbaB/EbfC family nucleoid-associated protein [Pseudomonadota bacterium]